MISSNLKNPDFARLKNFNPRHQPLWPLERRRIRALLPQRIPLRNEQLEGLEIRGLATAEFVSDIHQPTYCMSESVCATKLPATRGESDKYWRTIPSHEKCCSQYSRQTVPL